MQRLAPRSQTLLKIEPDLAIEIASVATATPEYKIAQADAVAHARQIFPHFDRLDGLFNNTGIAWRYSCVPLEWCHDHHGWPERSAEFQRHALDLLERVATEAVADAGLALEDVDMLVINTITGLAVPSLDALLLNRIGISETVERLPIFGFGCGGGVGGLARTARLVASKPDATALFLSVELCSLCARPDNPSLAAFVSGALFGDGAGAVVLRNTNNDCAGATCGRPSIRAVGEHCWRKTEHILGYTIRDDGFGMVLSAELPALMRENLGPAIHAFLKRHGMSLDEFDGFLFHPGGRKILETAEDVLGLNRHDLSHSWSTLRDYGNMSSAAILFVLKRAIDAGQKGRNLISAFGPGFSAYFIAADL